MGNVKSRHWRLEVLTIYDRKAQMCFEVFFTKGGYSFRTINCTRELLPFGEAAEKTRLSILGLFVGTKRCLETDDLRVLDISENCSRLTFCSTHPLYCDWFHRKEDTNNNTVRLLFNTSYAQRT